ncbi:hypothetical protein [Clostridium massiliamazoniense]|nr:hypothetical protein [Clostridium massiliamazoniense]
MYIDKNEGIVNEDIKNLSEIDRRLRIKRLELMERQQNYRKSKKWWRLWN